MVGCGSHWSLFLTTFVNPSIDKAPGAAVAMQHHLSFPMYHSPVPSPLQGTACPVTSMQLQPQQSLLLTISAAISKCGRLCCARNVGSAERNPKWQPNGSPESKTSVFSFVLAKICEEIRASSYTLTAFLSWHCKWGNRKGFWKRLLKPFHRIGEGFHVKNIQAFPLPPKTPVLFKEIGAWKFFESSLTLVPPNNYLAFVWPSLTLQTKPKTHPAAAILVYGLINIGK